MNTWAKFMHDTGVSRLDKLIAAMSLASTNLRRLLLFPTDQKHI